MKNIYKIISLFVLTILIGCANDNIDVDLENIDAPANISALTTVTQDNTGKVTFLPKGEGATQYKINFGDGSAQSDYVSPGTTVTHTYAEGSYKAKISAAHSRELSANNDVETMRREVAAMVLTAATEASNAAAQARAYSGDIHDKAQLTTKTIEAAWISSKAPLTDLLDSARTLFSIRLEQRRMIAMQLAALEELQTLVPDR